MPETAPACRIETTITSLAHQFADGLLRPEGAKYEPKPGDPLVVELNIYPDELEQFLGMKDTVLTSVNAMGL